MILIPLMLGAVLGEAPVAQSDRVQLALDSKGSLSSYIDKRDGREWITGDKLPPLFRMDWSREDNPGATRSCDSTRAKHFRAEPWSQGKDSGLRAVFSGFEGLPIEVTCTIFHREGEDWTRFAIQTGLPSGVTLESVVYPIVGITPAPGVDDDAAVVGATKGGIHHMVDWKLGETRRFEQPGSLGAGFGCYYDTRGGICFAALDPECHRKNLSMRRTGAGLDLAWGHPCLQRGRFILPYDVAVTTFSGDGDGRPTDWRDAADRYKKWAMRQHWCTRRFFEREEIPDWLKSGAAMVRFTRAWLSQPEEIHAWFRDYWQKEFKAEPPLIAAYWGWEKVGKWVGPDYFPAYPSDARFMELVRLGREMGVHTFLWPSGYNHSLSYGKRADGSFLWDVRNRFESICRPHTTVLRDGSHLMRDCTWLRGGQHCVLCPGDPWTVAWLNHSATECAQHGAEVIQIDQVVGGRMPVCYAKSHGHPPGAGRWSADAFREQLRTMARSCRGIEPDSVIGFEEPNEWFLQEVGIQDYRDCDLIWDGREPASVFAYLYHEYVPTLFQSNRPQTGHDPAALAWCLVHGQMPHFAPRLGIGPGKMIVDGGFERFSDEGPVEFPRTMWFPGEQWATGETEIDLEKAHGGRASLKLYNPDGKGRAMAAQNYEVGGDFRPGATYRLSAWMRSEKIEGANGIAIKAFAPGMRALQTWQLPYPTHQPEWERRKIEFTIPEGTAVMRLVLSLGGGGVVWLDDLRMEKLSSDGVAADALRTDLPIDHELMRRWLELYHGEGRPYLLFGKMLHPPPVQIQGREDPRTLPSVLHNAFEAPDGSRAVILANWTALPQNLSLIWNDQRHAITLSPYEVHIIK